MNIKHIWLIVLLIGFIACDEDDNNILPDAVVLPELTDGSADFSNYVAVGASFTAGMTDGATFKAGQENSFPKMLSMEFAKIGGGDFIQPLVNDNFGGLAFAGTRIAPPRLVFGGDGPVPLESVIGPVTVSTDITLNNPTGPFNNLGLMGSPKSFHFIAPGYGNIANFPGGANPYAVRLTGNTPDASLIDLAVNQNPTFFTLTFFSGNDALSYATSGGDGSEPLTDQGTFDFAFNTAIQQLTANGAKGIVTNTPFPEDLPYFTAIPNNALVLDAEQAASLTGFFQAVAGIFTQGAVFQGLPLEQAQALAAQYAITFNEGPNRFLIDVPAIPTNPLGFRQMTEEERILLTINRDALANQGYGSVALTPEVLQVLGLLQAGGTPTPQQAGLVISAVNGIDDSDVLDNDEIEAMTNAIIGYNNTVEAEASSNENIALVDLKSIFENALTNGVTFGGFNMNTDLVTGGFIGLDGIHLTARGYSYMASKYLEAIDASFGSNFIDSGNTPDPNDYPTNYSPLLQ
ncbi:SGNH/GDSL hydrolase family protein [Flaviramulus aquimarinus]|uniref:SGNH/GDSL hydrolase family protein n=1 Tax=Flaviramulus aquimarinus TaxID=1170456 RepID=A0ABP9EYS2_9FLAO